MRQTEGRKQATNSKLPELGLHNASVRMCENFNFRSGTHTQPSTFIACGCVCVCVLSTLPIAANQKKTKVEGRHWQTRC